MLGKMNYFIYFVLLIGTISSIQAEPFSLRPTFDVEIGNEIAKRLGLPLAQ